MLRCPVELVLEMENVCESCSGVQMSVKMSKCFMHERLPTRSHSTLKRMHIWPEQKEGRQSHSVSEMENGSSVKYPVTCLQLFLALEEITIITLLLLLPHICLIAFFLRSKSHTHNYIIS